MGVRLLRFSGVETQRVLHFAQQYGGNLSGQSNRASVIGEAKGARGWSSRFVNYASLEELVLINSTDLKHVLQQNKQSPKL